MGDIRPLDKGLLFKKPAAENVKYHRGYCSVFPPLFLFQGRIKAGIQRGHTANTPERCARDARAAGWARAAGRPTGTRVARARYGAVGVDVGVT